MVNKRLKLLIIVVFSIIILTGLGLIVYAACPHGITVCPGCPVETNYSCGVSDGVCPETYGVPDCCDCGDYWDFDCGHQCCPGMTKCEGDDYYTCDTNKQWVDSGCCADSACGVCEKCVGNACVNQLNGEDIRSECAVNYQQCDPGGEANNCGWQATPGYCDGSGACASYGTCTNCGPHQSYSSGCYNTLSYCDATCDDTFVCDSASDCSDSCGINTLEVSIACTDSCLCGSGTTYTCNSGTHTNCQSRSCGGSTYYCTYDGSTWEWRTSNPSEVCNDGEDNDCDGECDYDSMVCTHGDNNCLVSITVNPSVSNSNPCPGEIINVTCTSNVANVNSIDAFIGTTKCSYIEGSWVGNTVKFRCTTSSTPTTQTIKCAVNNSKSYQSGTNKTTQITVGGIDCCNQYPNSASCEGDTACDWCFECTGTKWSGDIDRCVAAGNCDPYCWQGQCGATCDATNGGCSDYCSGDILYFNVVCDDATCACTPGSPQKDLWLEQPQKQYLLYWNYISRLWQSDVWVCPHPVSRLWARASPHVFLQNPWFLSFLPCQAP